MANVPKYFASVDDSAIHMHPLSPSILPHHLSQLSYESFLRDGDEYGLSGLSPMEDLTSLPVFQLKTEVLLKGAPEGGCPPHPPDMTSGEGWWGAFYSV